jgi:hypothetical protein
MKILSGGPLDGHEIDICLDVHSPYVIFQLAKTNQPTDLYAMYKHEDGMLKFIETKTKKELISDA